MRKTMLTVVSLMMVMALLSLGPSSLNAQDAGPKIGETVPDFTLPDTYGKDRSIQEYRGQYVVLEWLNYGCPSVKKHYNAGNMQMLQEKYGEMEVVWLSIVSSAPGNQGHYEPAEMNAVSAEQGNEAAALDESMAGGEVSVALTKPYG